MKTETLEGISLPVALVVDDEPLIRMDTADIIAGAGYHVVEAASADEALQFIESHAALALLFTDVNTGGSVNGFELARRVTELWPEIHVIVASGERLPAEGDIPDDVQFIRKPFSAQTVLQMLQERRGRR